MLKNWIQMRVTEAIEAGYRLDFGSLAIDPSGLDVYAPVKTLRTGEWPMPVAQAVYMALRAVGDEAGAAALDRLASSVGIPTAFLRKDGAIDWRPAPLRDRVAYTFVAQRCEHADPNRIGVCGKGGHWKLADGTARCRKHAIEALHVSGDDLDRVQGKAVKPAKMNKPAKAGKVLKFEQTRKGRK